jgi:hypothetical protein
MNKEYDYVYAVIRVDDYKGADCPADRKVTVKEILWDETSAQQEVERLNALGKQDVRYFSQVTRLIAKPELPSAPDTAMETDSRRQQQAAG